MQEGAADATALRSTTNSRLRSWLLGCGVGCLALLILGVATCTGFVVWLRQPGELLEPERLFSTRSRGYVEWTLSLDDPGTSAFVEQVLAATRQDPEQLRAMPDWVRWLAGWQRRRDERQLREMFPMVLAWTVRPAATGDRDLHLGTVSMARLGNRLVLTDWALGLALSWSPAAEVEQYAGERIYRFEEEGSPVFFLRGSDVFVTSDATSARDALDLLTVGERPLEDDPTDLRELFGALAVGRPLRGVVDNDSGALARVWDRLVGPGRVPLTAENVDAATVVGSFENARDFVVRIAFRCREPGFASAQGEAVVSALRDSFDGVDVEVTSAPRGEWLDVELRLRDLPGAVERTFRFGG